MADGRATLGWHFLRDYSEYILKTGRKGGGFVVTVCESEMRSMGLHCDVILVYV